MDPRTPGRPDVSTRVPRLEDTVLARMVDDFARSDAWCHLAVPEDLRASLLEAARDKALAIARLLVHARTVGLLEPVPPRELAPEPAAGSDAVSEVEPPSREVAGAPPMSGRPHEADTPRVPGTSPGPATPPPIELREAEPAALPAPIAQIAPVAPLAPLAPAVPEPVVEAAEEPTEERRPAIPPLPAPPSAVDQLASKWKQGPSWKQAPAAPAGRPLDDILEALGPPEPEEPLDALFAEYRRRDQWAVLDGDVAALLTELFVARLRAIQARGPDPRADECVKGLRWWAKDRANRFVRGLRLADGPRHGSWHLDAQAYWRELAGIAGGMSQERVARRRPPLVPSGGAGAAPAEETLLHVVEHCAETCTNLLFLPSAFASAKDSPYRNPETVRSALRAIDEVAGRWTASLDEGGMGASWYDALREHGFDYKSRISETTRGQYGDDYTFLYEGEKVLFHEHITIGKKQADRCLSIHFHRDPAARRVVVAHVGRHLTNTLT